MIEKKQNNAAFVRGAAWLGLSTLLLKVIGLIYKIPLSYMLGDEGMGYFNSAYTVYVLFYVIGTSGIPKAIAILVAKKEAESPNEANAIFRIAFKFFFISGLILLVIFILMADAFSQYISNPKAVLAMYSIAPSILFVCAGGVIRGYLSGKIEFAPIAVSELIFGVLKLALGLLLATLAIRMGKPLHAVAAYTIFGITVGSLVSLIYLALVYFKGCKSLERASLSSNDTIKDILKISVPITLTSAVGSIVSLLDLTLIMRGLESNGYTSSLSNVLYGSYTTLAVPMLSLVTTLISPITTAILPLLASSFVCKSKDSYCKHLDTSLSLTSIVTVPSAVLFAFFSDQALLLIFEEGSAILAAPFLALLSPGILLIGPLTVLNTALEGAGKSVTAFFSVLVGAAAKLVITLSLLSTTDLGILCAPIGTSASYLVSLFISRAQISNIRGVKTSVLRSFLIPSIASAISAFGTEILAKSFDFLTSVRLRALVCMLVFFLLYAISLLLLSPHARNLLVKCGKINKKRTKQL